MALLTGMRKSEIMGLRWEEVNLARGAVVLAGERTKNGRQKVVPLNVDARRVLLEAKKNRSEGCPWVFHKTDGSRLGNIRRGFEGACKRAGIKDFCFHDLRHCFASALAMRGESLQVIGALMGHRTLGMTQRYAHLSPDVLRGAVEQASKYMRGEEPEGVARLPEADDEADVIPLRAQGVD